MVYYINEMAPEGLKATDQTIATASYMGISGILGNYLGGIIIDRYEIHTMYKLDIAVQATAVAGFLLSLLILRHREQTAEKTQQKKPKAYNGSKCCQIMPSYSSHEYFIQT